MVSCDTIRIYYTNLNGQDVKAQPGIFILDPPYDHEPPTCSSRYRAQDLLLAFHVQSSNTRTLAERLTITSIGASTKDTRVHPASTTLKIASTVIAALAPPSAAQSSLGRVAKVTPHELLDLPWEWTWEWGWWASRLWVAHHVRDVAPGETRSGAYGDERRSGDSDA